MSWQQLLLACLLVLPITGTVAIGMLMVLRKLDLQHQMMNSRMDELVESTRLAATAVGELKGREDERDEAKARARPKRPK